MKTCPQCSKTYKDAAVFCPRDGSRLVEGSDPTDRIVAGRYQIIEMIGQGGMGIVFKAVHTGIGRICALKLFTALSSKNEVAIARFEREARMAGRIDNPHAVTLYDFGQDEAGTPFLAMEFIEGLTLSQVFARERVLPIDRVIHISTQIADALSAAHNLGIVHSDLKPDNIMLTRKGADDDYVKVLDFGLARILVEGSGEITTMSGLVMGNPTYMSPEMLRGERLDARSDVYSLAIIVYEMLSGQHPFEGDSPHARMIKKVMGDPIPLSEAAPSVSKAVERAVVSALARDRESRPPSAKAFADQLSIERRPPPSQSRGIQPGSAPPQSPAGNRDVLASRPMPKAPAFPSAPESPQQTSVGSPPPGSGVWEKITGWLRGGQDATEKSTPPVQRHDAQPGTVCARCGHSNKPGGAFCVACGAPILVSKTIVRSSDPSQAGQTRPPAQDKAEIIRRHTDVSFPAKARAGKVYSLRVQIVPAEVELETGEVKPAPKPHPHDITMALEVPKPSRPEEAPPPIRVMVSVAAENFEIEGKSQADIIVPVSGKSPAATFQLIGQEVGLGRIMLDFAQDGRPVGSVDLSAVVIPAGATETYEQATAIGEVGFSTSRASSPDVVIKVFEHRFADQPGQLHFVLSSINARLKDLPVMDGDLGTVDLRAEVAQWVERQLLRVGAVARKKDSRPEEVSRILSDVGNSLYDQLLPQALKEICWVLRDRGVKSMLILSDEPHIPWELIKPYRINPVTGDFDADGEYWGESFALTHWLRGRPPAEQLSFNRIFAVAAGGSSEPEQATWRDFEPDPPAASLPAGPKRSGAGLKAADEELSILRSFEARGSQINVLPARTSELRQAFEAGDFDLLHLACHGAFGGVSTGDASAVLMEDGTFSAIDLSPKMAAALRRASPLIFFNACHSGRIGFSLTRLGSWGAQLIELGCGGFVGSLWPVTDEGALAFARAFYAVISAGAPIGEAVLRARLEVRNIYPNDPTWIAYCCFADPMARVATVIRSQNPEERA